MKAFVFLECPRRNQCNGRQQRWQCTRIFVLKQHQTQPSADEPQNDRDPFGQSFDHKICACDEHQEQRKKQLVTFESARIKTSA